MAWLQVDSVRKQTQDIGEWSSNIKVKNTHKLYDCDDNITAYCVEFSDKDNNDCGYVVVGANDIYEPIIEFATSGDFFTEKGEKTYYLGKYYDSEWKFYKKCYLNGKSDIKTKAEGASIQTITSKDAYSFIYNPYVLEDGWISIAPIDAAKYNITYFSTSDFSGYDNHCGPTAGTNLMLYWQNKNSSKVYENHR